MPSEIKIYFLSPEFVTSKQVTIELFIGDRCIANNETQKLCNPCNKINSESSMLSVGGEATSDKV